MSLLQSFILPIKGLADGSHEFHFILNQNFFAQYETSQIQKSEIEVRVYLEKKSTLLSFQFDYDGVFGADCDRCMADIDVSIKDSFELFVKYSLSESTDIDVVHIDPDAFEFDLSPYLYEFAHLALPAKRLRDCEADNEAYCDQEALDKLDYEVEEEHDEQQENKLWEALSNIKLDN